MNKPNGLLAFALMSAVSLSAGAQELKLSYNATDTINATTLKDLSGNGYDGKLVGTGVSISKKYSEQSVFISTSRLKKGYIDLGENFGKVVADLDEYTIAMRTYVSSSYMDLSKMGNIMWSFAMNDSVEVKGGGYASFSARNMDYCISLTDKTDVSTVSANKNIDNGAYRWVVVTCKKNALGNFIRIYEDGLCVANGVAENLISELGETKYNWLGRSPFYTDDAEYTRGMIMTDFRVYDGAMTDKQVAELSGIEYTGSEPEKLLQYSFSNADDETGKYKGSLENGAELRTIADVPVLSLGDNNGYFDFGSEVGSIIGSLDGDYAISMNVYIPADYALGSNGNFIFNFGNSSTTGYLFFGANQTKFAITQTNYSGERVVSADTKFPTGRWVNLIYCQTGNTGTIYMNGAMTASGNIGLFPNKLGSTTQNWLGRSPYSGDVYLKGAMYNDVRVYKGTLSSDEIISIYGDAPLTKLNDVLDAEIIDEFIANQAYDFSNLRTSVTLPTSFGNGITATWTSSDENVIKSNGTVIRPEQGEEDATVTLTATYTKGNITKSVEYQATVLAKFSDAEALAYDLDNLKLSGSLNNLRSDLVLPGNTGENTIITWKSDKPEYISDAGKLMKLSAKGEGKVEVTLTATGYKNKEVGSKDFKVLVAEDEDYDAYLFVYFPSNSNENLYYAVSKDGYSYTPLNNGERVMWSDTVAIKKGIRDPHILRGADGKTFYMVATDMRCAEGWSSNRGIVMYKSTDMIHWQHSTVHFPDRFPEWKNVTRVWAPEVIWDANYENADGTKGRYMVYYSLLTNDGKCTYDKVYYSYANDDFTDLLTDPVFLYDRGSATIDADIIFDERDSTYHMIYKNEGSGGICQVTSKRLTAEEGMPEGSQWSEPSGNLQQTNVAVEGGGLFRMINSDTWVLMYDCYNSGYYQFCSTEDLESFTLEAQTTTSGAFTPRHGTVMAISKAELDALLEAFPTDNLGTSVSGARNRNIKQNNVTITSKSIYLPVRPGTDISSFDPELVASAGAAISPEGPQDFTNGSVEYTISNQGKTATVNVEVEVCGNPVLDGFCADPEILFSKKTGKFYIYPTSDGYAGWGGSKFNVYSSSDLVNWQKENCILDVATDDVTWATGNGWAPCIEEKYMDGAFKYFFYFSGHNPEYNMKTLGVATADSPIGPFTDKGTPLVTKNPASGQLIDSDVFTDPVSGNTYYYWGNGNLVVSDMGDDMMSYSNPATITPAGGSLADYAFREGVYVFYRNGLYYFLWSVDDTGAKNYHVAYGTSTSPRGPIKVADKPIVIIQDASEEIYGTGHNAVIQIPGKDEWYIVYHRINKAYLNNGPGYHREVCIDKLEFNEDGTIKQVTPTHKGIDPVDMSDYITGTLTCIEDLDDASGCDEVVSTSYYSINGTNLGTNVPAVKGIYIKVDNMKDGSRKAVKFIK